MKDLSNLKALQALTGAGMGACEKALSASGQSVSKAARQLRRRGEAPLFRLPGKPSTIPLTVVQKGYRFDSWAETIAMAIDQQLQALSPSEPLSVVVHWDDMGLWPVEAAAQGATGEPRALELYKGWDPSTFAIRHSFDESDPVLEHFFETHLDHPDLRLEAFSSGDFLRLPGIYWRLALHQVARLVQDRCAMRKSPAVTCVIQCHDDVLKSGEESFLWATARGRIRLDLPDMTLRAAFQSMIYDTSVMQQRLLLGV